MKIFDCEQYSDAWWAVRRGIPTASAADKIITPKTAALSGQADGYMNKLIAERFGFDDEARDPTDWELRGRELEPEARAYFEFENALPVRQVGFVTNEKSTAGCSPDGLVCMKGGMVPDTGFETKCPKASTQIGYLRAGGLPAYYKPQVHFSMAVTGLDKWWFMSYFPGLDPLIVLVERDEYTEKVAAAVKQFTDRLAAESERLGIAA